MIYSCFNPPLGLYEYFEDDRQHPTNGDLPVPKLPKQTGRVGVPAMDAGRPLPTDAKRMGTGWEARGMIVNCKPMATPGLSGLGEHTVQTAAVKEVLFIAGLGGIGYAVADRAGVNPTIGAAAGTVIGLILRTVL